MYKTVKLIIEYSKQWNEYQVIPIFNGKRNEKQTYYTNDKQDAKDTCLAMQQEYINKGFNVNHSLCIKTIE